jgi:DNA-directed RNA polymerase subunit K/omega
MDNANQSPEQVILAEPAAPIHSRFLFVDVAALRAKQLRRGARMRFEAAQMTSAPQKPERVAMEEVRRGLVFYAIQDLQSPSTENGV